MGKSKTKSFQTETKQLLQLMIHSLYSNKEIFLRELISNASDALDKLRFKSISSSKLASLSDDLKIKVIVDKESKTLTISDNGIGMAEEEIIENIGTIARSGTAEFLGKLTGDKKKDSNLIGQFGVGFYSVFMIAEKVQVLSKSAQKKSSQPILWESSGEDKYKLTEVEKKSHGTDIIIYLSEENYEFADKQRISLLINKYSQYINFPIYLSNIDEEEEIINEADALWLKPKRSIKDSEYIEFYKFISFDQDDPLLTIHNKVEGKQEYSNLLYIPKKPPFDLWNRESPRGIKLYIQRVFIMDDAVHFLPLYLRFIRGVIDSSDLPLNVSREILQDHPFVDSIKKALTKRVIDALKKLKENDFNAYKEFWKEYGLVLKEGPAEDLENKELIAELLLFASSNKDEHEVDQTLDNYISRMPSDQKGIYYCVADTFEGALNSPHLESLKSKNTEVLLLTDRIDEWLMSTLFEFKGKSFINVAKTSNEAEKKPKTTKDQNELLTKVADHLGVRVSEVLPSSRLKDSACCLVLQSSEPGIQLRKILEAAGQKMGDVVPIFELNMKHKLISKLSKIKGKDFKAFVDFLYDYAVIAEGGSPKDPSKYLRQLDKYLSE